MDNNDESEKNNCVNKNEDESGSLKWFMVVIDDSALYPYFSFYCLYFLFVIYFIFFYSFEYMVNFWIKQ